MFIISTNKFLKIKSFFIRLEISSRTLLKNEQDCCNYLNFQLALHSVSLFLWFVCVKKIFLLIKVTNFLFYSSSSGLVGLKNAKSNNYLVALKNDNVRAAGHASNHFIWIRKAWSNGYLFFIHINSHKCLSTSNNGRDVSVAFCNGSSQQQWKEVNGLWKNRATGKCLTVDSSGELIFVTSCGSSFFQNWSLVNKTDWWDLNEIFRRNS